MALRKWAGYIALHPVTVCTDHQSLQSWHKEHVDTPSGPASRRARWHETLAKFDLTVVYIPGKDNTVADRLSRWAYPASKGMQDISAHGDEAETAEAKRIIEMERLMEEEGAKCFVVMAADAPLASRVSRAVSVLAPEGAESDKHLFPESCSRTTGQHVSLSYAAHEADSDDDYAEQDDYTVEKILAQRPKALAPGGLEFKVRWRGYGPSHDTWEPVSSFVPRVNTPFMEYIHKHKTKIHVSDLAALTRAIAARGA